MYMYECKYVQYTEPATKLYSFAFPVGLMIKSKFGYAVRMDEIPPRISVDRAPKPMRRFCIAGIYCFCCRLVSIANLGLTGFGNLDRPYLIYFQVVVSRRRRAMLSFTREKHTIGNATRSRQWSFTLTGIASRCASVRDSENWHSTFLKTTAFVLDMSSQ
jgi:hypothetical protein